MSKHKNALESKYEPEENAKKSNIATKITIRAPLTEFEIGNIQNAANDALKTANKLYKQQKKQRAANKYEEALKLFEQISNDEQATKILQKLQAIYIKLENQEKLQKITNIIADKTAATANANENNTTDKAELVIKVTEEKTSEEKVEKDVGAKDKPAHSLTKNITSFEEIPTKHEGDIRVVSYNVTGDGFDNKDKTFDQHHHWNYRAPLIKTMLTSVHPDVFCLQEISPNQAVEMENYFCKHLGYKAAFLSQTPSEIETGAIAFGDEISSWQGKWPSTFLIGTFVSKDWNFAPQGAGRFWLNENPDQVPENLDRGTTDKGFGNMNTYRAVLWVKIENAAQKSLFVFNSHYPLDGTSKTRFECAKVEMRKIAEITKGAKWVSTGDRNLILLDSDNDSFNTETIYQEFVKSAHDVRDSSNHYGVSTSWVGFTYDNYKNTVVDGDFKNNKTLDLMVSNMESKLSFSHPGAINPETMQLVGLSNPLDDVQNEGCYYASDHCMIGGDF